MKRHLPNKGLVELDTYKEIKPVRCPGLYYPSWRRARINAILDHYGREFFYDKKILELGCGDGSMGNFFYLLGCRVTSCDARQEYLDEAKRRNHEIRVVQADLNKEWPFGDEIFDIVLHLGLLYHLENPEFSILKSCFCSDHVILDSELTISGTGVHKCPEAPPRRADPQIDGMDHAWDGKDGEDYATGCRPAPQWIEQTFEDAGFTHHMCHTEAYDDHPYPIKIGWKDNVTTGWVNGRRGLWFCKRKKEVTA